MKTLIIAMILTALSACGNQARQGPALTLPHTVVIVDTVELVMDRASEHGELIFRAVCTDTGPTEAIEQIVIEVATVEASTTAAYSREAPTACTSEQPYLLRIPGDVIDQREPDTRFAVSLTVQRAQRTIALTECYVKNRDGGIHEVNDPDSCLAS
jgi:hypothetical protein